MKSPSILVAIFSMIGSLYLFWFFSAVIAPGKGRIENAVDPQKAYQIILSKGDTVADFKEKADLAQDYMFLRSISPSLWKIAEISYFCTGIVISLPWISFLYQKFKKKRAEQDAAANP